MLSFGTILTHFGPSQSRCPPVINFDSLGNLALKWFNMQHKSQISLDPEMFRGLSDLRKNIPFGIAGAQLNVRGREVGPFWTHFYNAWMIISDVKLTCLEACKCHMRSLYFFIPIPFGIAFVAYKWPLWVPKGPKAVRKSMIFHTFSKKAKSHETL